jgi:hypothetical protein
MISPFRTKDGERVNALQDSLLKIHADTYLILSREASHGATADMPDDLLGGRQDMLAAAKG